ncbi:MAG: hypothetical protein M1828_006561 [Chrysothrix sp. TS-e1954]|nr:MAG: hypothetical protein M1828_006561 [Chrysothrix sp. TS-e1954]
MPSPMITATLQATALSSISNILAQIFDAYNEQKPFTFSFLQLLRFQLWTMVSAPPNFQWQAWLERTFPGRAPIPTSNPTDNIAMQEEGNAPSSERKPSTDSNNPRDSLIAPEDASEPAQNPLDWRNTALKWFIDCMTIGHLFNTVGFLLVMGMLKVQTPTEILDGFKREFWMLIIAGYKMWPLASVINFTLIPVERRIVFLSFVGLCWGIFLSLVAARV